MHDPYTYPLKMSDLQYVSSQYVSNVAVDYWRLNSSSQSAPHAVMSMSPRENQRIDQPPGHTVNFSPNDVSLVDAMVTSAAVMAISPEQNEPFRDLQIMLGLRKNSSLHRIRNHHHPSLPKKNIARMMMIQAYTVSGIIIMRAMFFLGRLG